MNKLISSFAIIGIAVSTIISVTSCTQTAKAKNVDEEKYEADWESLKNYEAPEWYEDAKLGFWVHWGVYSVPGYRGDHASEWYGRWMYSQDGQSGKQNRGYKTHQHHIDTYGDPSGFGYKDFIPQFKAEHFNAEEWADLCVDGGAKFFTMMAAHHDAFCLWDTKLSKWNSVNMGPKRNLVGEISTAVRERGLKFGVSNHTAWNFQFFEFNHINGYDAKDTAYQDLYGNPDFIEGKTRASKRDIDRWLERTNELCDMYQPDLYYFDWGHGKPGFEPGRKAFGAHYYNKAIEWGAGSFGKPGVVLNYKEGFYPEGSAVHDIERGRVAEIADMVWQTDDCVYDGHTWGYVPNIPIKPTNRIVDELMDIISKRGVLMLSFAPKADGTFPDDQKTMIYELGAWLKICGEAVYSTRPWEIYGEGPANEMSVAYDGHSKGDEKKDGYGGQDIRFTRNKANNTLYATVLDWPEETITIKAFAGKDINQLKSIRLLGQTSELNWLQTEEGLVIELDGKPDYDFAYPIKIEFEKEIVTIK